MKKVEHYVCEVCGTEYRDEKTCYECETRHHKPVEIRGAKWVPMKENRLGYPTQIRVKMSNGEIVTYRR